MTQDRPLTAHPDLRLTPAEARLAMRMAQTQGVTYDDVHRLLYGQDLPPDAPAHQSMRSARVIVHRLRAKFSVTGFKIFSERSRGWYVSPRGQEVMRHWLATGRAPQRQAAA